MKRVLARAYANIALCKYWGKLPGAGNLPATPSISLALRELYSDTEIIAKSKAPDNFVLNGREPDQATRQRLQSYLKIWRQKELLRGHFEIVSKNTFPTKSGLASSSSGYAALATALAVFAPRKLSLAGLSRLARLGSGSAARSLTGGLSCLPVGTNPAAQLLVPPEKIPWGMVVASAEETEKAIGSREGMEMSRRSSPYYSRWLQQARLDYHEMLTAIRNRDFSTVGQICEANTLAMHACMLSTRPALLYWNSATMEMIRTIINWRERGPECYFTIDAGAQVIILARQNDLSTIARKAAKVPGVLSVRASMPAGGAAILEQE